MFVCVTCILVCKGERFACTPRRSVDCRVVKKQGWGNSAAPISIYLSIYLSLYIYIYTHICAIVIMVLFVITTCCSHITSLHDVSLASDIFHNLALSHCRVFGCLVSCSQLRSCRTARYRIAFCPVVPHSWECVYEQTISCLAQGGCCGGHGDGGHEGGHGHGH